MNCAGRILLSCEAEVLIQRQSLSTVRRGHDQNDGLMSFGFYIMNIKIEENRLYLMG